ncbi:MAG: succinyldiaminopimelate transaminase [Planctomycetes bacterium]|nr:succinyldiaminopimelate transaminase [Planctomycetota bacterium]
MPTVNPVLAALPDYPIVRIEAAKERLRQAGREVFDFGTGDPIEPTPAHVRQALLEAVPDVCRYPTYRGAAELRRAAAGYLQRRFGVAVEPDREVLGTLGSKEAIFNLPFAFLERGGPRDVVVFPTPGYPVFEAGTRFAGGRPHGVPLRPENRFLLEPWALPREVRERLAVVWINYPHNPTGALAPADYLERIARFAAEEDVLVCSDECYVDVYSDEAPRSLLEAGTRNILAFFSCSKRSGMTGYRSGFVAGDPALIATFGKLRPNVGTASQVFVDHAAAAAWADDAHAAARRATFQRKRALFDAFFREAGLEQAGGDGTFFMWFRAPGGDDEAYAARLLEQGGLVLIPGSYFGPGGEGFCRLALVPDLETCERAIVTWRQLH